MTSSNCDSANQITKEEISYLKPYFKKIIESPQEFFQFIGGIIGLCDGIYSSVVADKISFFSTIKIANDSFVLRIFNVVINIGTRSNWYFNFGAAVDVFRKLFSPRQQVLSLTVFQKLKLRFRELTNKQIGHLSGIFVGICIYSYVMSQLSEYTTLDSLFKSADNANINISRSVAAQIFINIDQPLLICGGLSNIFSYVGNWLDGISGNRTLFYAFSQILSSFYNPFSFKFKLPNNDVSPS